MMISARSSWVRVILASVSLAWIVPIIGIVVMSFRPEVEIVRGWWRFSEATFTLQNWLRVWSAYPVLQSLWYSMVLAVISTALPVFASPAAAYAYHYLRFPGRRLTFLLLINTYVLPPQVQVIPLLKLWRDLGLIDNIWSVIIPYVGLSFSWAVFLVKSFLSDFPDSLIDSARLDGCNNLRTYWHIVQPNVITPIAAVAILQFMWTWNSLLLPLIFLREKVPLPVLLGRMQGIYEPNWDLVAVTAIVTIVLPLAIFLTFQRYFSLGASVQSGAKA